MTDELSARGVDFVPMSVLQRERIPADLRRRNWRVWLGGWALRREILGKLAPHRSGAPVVALSLEDWIGMSQDMLAPTLYPFMERRFGKMARSLAAVAPVHIFLAIRSWDEILPAAYATVLRFSPFEGGFEPVRRRALATPPDWAAFARRLQAAVPDATLHVWRYEDYRTNAKHVCDAFCGHDIGKLPEIPDPKQTKTPTFAGVAEAERLDQGLGMFERRDRVAMLYARHSEKGGEKYMPFTPEERARLRTLYKAQCAAIFADPRIRRVI